MEIAILGTGRVGSVLGRRWAEAGHTIHYGVLDPQAADVQAVVHQSGPNARACRLSEAAAAGQVIVLAIPWEAADKVIHELGPLDGKVLIDCINPLQSDLQSLQLGFHTSAAEQIAEWAPSAAVVKAFNTVSDATMNNPWYGDQQASMFFCGDNQSAKDAVRELTRDLEMEPVDAGALVNARQLEPLAALYCYLAIHGGWGGNCAFKMVRRPED